MSVQLCNAEMDRVRRWCRLWKETESAGLRQDAALEILEDCARYNDVRAIVIQELDFGWEELARINPPDTRPPLTEEDKDAARARIKERLREIRAKRGNNESKDQLS